MKTRLKSKTLADARREVYGMTDAVPYKIVLGRGSTEDGRMEPCYYMFETRADHEAWLRGYYEEHQLVGSVILRMVIKNQNPQYWFDTDSKEVIIQRIKDFYGCGTSTAKWVFHELCHIYDKSRFHINE